MLVKRFLYLSSVFVHKMKLSKLLRFLCHSITTLCENLTKTVQLLKTSGLIFFTLPRGKLGPYTGGKLHMWRELFQSFMAEVLLRSY